VRQLSGRRVLINSADSGLTPVPAAVCEAAAYCRVLVSIECRVAGIQTIGDHDLILGEVLAVHADGARDEQGNLIWDNPDFLVYAWAVIFHGKEDCRPRLCVGSSEHPKRQIERKAYAER
jgi:hypothetical protein